MQTPAAFGSWPLNERADWLAFELSRGELVQRLRDVLGTGSGSTSDCITVADMAEAVEQVTNGETVISAKHDRPECVRIFRETIGVDAEKGTKCVTKREIARALLLIGESI